MKTSLAIMVGILTLGTGTAHAQNCSYSPPEYSPAWAKFNSVIAEQYDGGRLSGEARALAQGHAIKRMKAAAGNDSSRLADIDCIWKKLESDSLDGVIMGNLSNFHLDAMQEASNGLRDDDVAQMTGVRSSAPLTDAFAAGPVANGRLSAGSTVGGGGPRLIFREGSRPDPNGSANNNPRPADIFGTETKSEGPNYDDLPNGPNLNDSTDHWIRGFMMEPPPGINDVNNWQHSNAYYGCMTRAKKAERGAGILEDGYTKGTALILSLTNDDKFRWYSSGRNKFMCITRPAPIPFKGMKEMDERAAEGVRQCQRAGGKQWCKIWFMN